MASIALKLCYGIENRGDFSCNSQFSARFCSARPFGRSCPAFVKLSGNRSSLLRRAEKSGNEDKGSDGEAKEDEIGMFQRITTSAQVFAAALFWIILFFGSTAWEGRSKTPKGGGRSK